MDGNTTSHPTRRKKKTLNACQRCRRRKIKCSGQIPCQNCVLQGQSCLVEDRGKKVVVPEDYINGLQNRILDLESGSDLQDRSSPSRAPSRPSASASFSYNEINAVSASNKGRENNSTVYQTTGYGVPDEMSSFLGRPMYQISQKDQDPSHVNSLESLETGTSGDHVQYRYPGHSSTWAFSRRIRNMVNSAVGAMPLHDAIPIRDGAAYSVRRRENLVDLSLVDLPSQEFAEYLANTVSMSMGPLYYLYDEDELHTRIKEFYSQRMSGHNPITGLWHIQMLLVFAFGKSILAREATRNGPAGMPFFLLALEGLPDFHDLYHEPILAIEVLCLLVLFMQAADMRRAAYGYIGVAVRISLYQGMNVEGYVELVTPKQSEHRIRLWWTAYTIDRRLTSLMGVPLMLHDKDIALSMPAVVAGSAIAIALHVKLCSELGQLLDVVYGVRRELGSKFIAGIQSILSRLVTISSLLNDNMKIELQQPCNNLSRTAASLHLLYHHCIILAIRPVLFSLLQRRMESNATPALSDAVIGLLRMGVESAVQILNIIEALRSHNLLDLFLPFDLDTMFSAAFVLVLIDIITPAADEQWELEKTFTLLDEMLLRGIATVRAYKADLQELNELRLKLRNKDQGALSLTDQDTASIQSALHMRHHQSAAQEPLFNPHLDQDMIWSWMGTDSIDLGDLHPDITQSAIDGLNLDSLDGFSFDTANGNGWMWETDFPENQSWANVQTMDSIQ